MNNMKYGLGLNDVHHEPTQHNRYDSYLELQSAVNGITYKLPVGPIS